jgi:hypothetical protein
MVMAPDFDVNNPQHQRALNYLLQKKMEQEQHNKTHSKDLPHAPEIPKANL